ncbi:MAG: PaaI family thioesterase [Oligoflexales bacterium]|nr:PaaI family thioesterase [Oligoflexales bacterium]
MHIWKRDFKPEDLNNDDFIGTTAQMIGIEVIEIGEREIIARMPVNEKTKQPFGILNGGASCLLAETICSVAANICIKDENLFAVGLNLSAHHLSSVRDGHVYGRAYPRHIGKSTQVWEMDIEDDRKKPVCKVIFTVAVLQKRQNLKP